MEPFLDLRYPASDIPKQARELYKKNLIRMIGDIGAVAVPIFPQRDVNGQTLDMTFSVLRTVSPIHIEYLKNMGVGASMSISIMVGGELWGLIACHHSSAKIVPAGLRVAAELFGQFFSVQLEGKLTDMSHDLIRTKLLDENFTDLMESTARQAAQAVTEERLGYLASLIANGIDGERLSFVESKQILRETLHNPLQEMQEV